MSASVLRASRRRRVLPRRSGGIGRQIRADAVRVERLYRGVGRHGGDADGELAGGAEAAVGDHLLGGVEERVDGGDAGAEGAVAGEQRGLFHLLLVRSGPFGEGVRVESCRGLSLRRRRRASLSVIVGGRRS